MSKTVILYKSKYGATKKYVDWIQEKISCDMVNLKDHECKDFSSYDCIIFASGIYASGIAGIKSFKKALPDILNKKLVILAVGASPYSEKAIDHLRELNLKDSSIDIPIFYARGAFDEANMSFKDRTLCKMLKKMVGKKAPSDMELWEVELLQAVGSKNDWTSKENIEPMIAYLKQINTYESK